MAGSEVTVHAMGFSHPPHIKPIQRGPHTPVEWHKWECPAPEGDCRGCAEAPEKN